MKLFLFFSLLQILNDSTAVVSDGPNVLGIFLGNVTPDLLIAGFLMALLGLSFRLMYQAMTRDPVASGTPVHWSWTTFWDNKLKRILLNVGLNTLAIFFSIRFMEDMLGKPVTMLYCAGVGLSLDWIIRKIGKWKPESKH